METPTTNQPQPESEDRDMKRQWNESETYARQWYGLNGEYEVTFSLDGHIQTIVDLRPEIENGTIDPVVVADFR